MGDVPESIASLKDRVERWAHRCAGPPPAESERAALAALDTAVEDVVDHFDPAVIRRDVHTLVFTALYAAARDPAPEDDPSALPVAVPAALIAAEAEFRGPLRLNSRQNALLAETYEALAVHLSAARRFEHAALAYRRAMALHRVNEDDESEDRCGYLLARARTRALPRGGRRLAGQLSFLLCGHGYRPSWLLGWVAVQLAVFVAAGLLLGGEAPATTIVYLGLAGFLGPLGLEDSEAMNPAARPLFLAEAWIGVVTMSVFFALLVRKWFRL